MYAWVIPVMRWICTALGYAMTAAGLLALLAALAAWVWNGAGRLLKYSEE